eukprot:361251-Chlamydomonas_euryale.AAC.5
MRGRDAAGAGPSPHGARCCPRRAAYMQGAVMQHAVLEAGQSLQPPPLLQRQSPSHGAGGGHR